MGNRLVSDLPVSIELVSFTQPDESALMDSDGVRVGDLAEPDAAQSGGGAESDAGQNPTDIGRTGVPQQLGLFD